VTQLMHSTLPFVRSMRAALGLLAVISLAACAVPHADVGPDGINDPHEAQNRKMHAFNRDLDSGGGRGVAASYVDTVPADVRGTVDNFADNLSVPQTVVNQILQGDLNRATRNTFRFAINSTLGFGGLADVSTPLGLPKDDTDFGETLYVWGVPEGNYVELPLVGPSTQRRNMGRFVDLFTDPLGFVLTRQQRAVGIGSKVLETVNDRGRFADSVDSVLHGSADSYAQARIIYLQNRRFELGDETSGGAVMDPYDELYGDSDGQ